MARNRHPLYKTHYQWYHACNNPNAGHWHQYGGVGVKMHRPWNQLKEGFDRFEQWVLDNLGPQPFPEAVLRRIDTTGDIKPSNLMWSTRQHLCNTRKTNKMIKINGQKKSLADWARHYGKNYDAVYSRIVDYGFKPKDALTK